MGNNCISPCKEALAIDGGRLWSAGISPLDVWPYSWQHVEGFEEEMEHRRKKLEILREAGQLFLPFDQRMAVCAATPLVRPVLCSQSAIASNQECERASTLPSPLIGAAPVDDKRWAHMTIRMGCLRSYNEHGDIL